jgi:hypothetical protein
VPVLYIMDKKKLGIFTWAFSVLFASNLVSANNFTDALKTTASFFLGDVTSTTSGAGSTGEFIFIKFLLVLIIFAVVYYSVKQVPGLSGGLTFWLIVIPVTLLASRFLSDETLINFLFLPEGFLGVAFGTMLPFILFFFFIESFDSGLIRKFGWSAFAVVYIVLAIINWSSLAIAVPSVLSSLVPATMTPAVSGAIFSLAWLYVLIALLALLAVLFDKVINVAFRGAGSIKEQKAKIELRRIRIQRELDEVEEALTSRPESSALKTRKAHLDRIIKDLAGQAAD